MHSVRCERCGQWVGKRLHLCPSTDLYCARGHLRAEHWSPGGRRCLECQRLAHRGARAPRGSRRYMGDRCLNGHPKTRGTWRWNGHNWYCHECRRLRRIRKYGAARAAGASVAEAKRVASMIVPD